MKSVERTGEPTVVPRSSRSPNALIRWAEAAYALVSNPAYCAHCGVYLPRHDRVCEPCAAER